MIAATLESKPKSTVMFWLINEIVILYTVEAFCDIKNNSQ